MMRTALTLALLCTLLVSAHAAEAPIPPTPSRWATDTAGFLSPEALQATDQRLQEFERTTGTQLLVWIGETTGDAPLEDWAVRAFERWRVGRKDLDNGLVVFVLASDRKVRIEVGYGLEGLVPDAIASRIINDTIIPKIRAGDRDGAVAAAVDALIARIGQGPAPRPDPPNTAGKVGGIIVVSLVGVALLVMLVRNIARRRSAARATPAGTRAAARRGGSGYWRRGGGSRPTSPSRSRGSSGDSDSSGGSSSSDDSFSGGGGSSGGGGASGSW